MTKVFFKRIRNYLGVIYDYSKTNQGDLLTSLSFKKRFIFAAVFILLIISWQRAFTLNIHLVPDEYQQHSAHGLSKIFKHFYYFKYYLDLFPVVSLTPEGKHHKNLEYNKEYAGELLKDGEHLATEYAHATRFGDYGRLFMFSLDAWLKGSPEKPSVKSTNFVLFTGALVALFLSFMRIGKTGLGIILVLLLGSNSTQLLEVFRENIFSIKITLAIFLVALNLFFFQKNRNIKGWVYLAAPVASGIFISFAREIRPGLDVFLIAPFLVYLFMENSRFVKRLGMVALLFAAYLGTTYMVKSYFDNKIEEANYIVQKNGGTPYTGPRQSRHAFWHPVFVGLGDFDQDKGYELGDRCAYRYAYPFLKEKYGYEWDGRTTYIEHYYNQKKHYFAKFESIPGYGEILKNKVLSDITEDPLWYFTILLKRTGIVLTKNTPVQLNLLAFRASVFFPMFFAVIVMIFFLFRRDWFYSKLILFTFPLASYSILIYSARGMTLFMVAHIFTFAVLLYMLLQYIFAKYDISLHLNSWMDRLKPGRER